MQRSKKGVLLQICFTKVSCPGGFVLEHPMGMRMDVVRMVKMIVALNEGKFMLVVTCKSNSFGVKLWLLVMKYLPENTNC